MEDLLTSKRQAYWRERIQKETAARVTWNIRYGHKFLKERTKAKKQAPFRSALKAGRVPATSSLASKEVRVGQPEVQGVQNQLSRAVGVQGPPPKEVGIREVRGATQGPAGHSRPEGLEMRQAPQSTMKLLFQGISHDGQGRARYLQERHQQIPEEKFRYPILSSWEYGWHVGDVMKNSRTPAYAKIQPITKSLYIKSSVFYFPRCTDQLM